MLRVGTWNTLAPKYAIADRYLGVETEHLNAREEHIAEQLEQLLMDCDIIAVQEVGEKLFDTLQDLARNTLYAKRSGKDDGVALASNHLKLKNQQILHSGDGERRWACAKVEGIWVTSVHLDWDKEEAVKHKGVKQAEELTRMLRGQTGEEPKVLLGDINGPWEGKVGSMLKERNYQNLNVGPTAAIGGMARELDVIAVNGVSGVMEGKRTLPSNIWLPDEETPSDHLPLTAYLQSGDKRVSDLPHASGRN
jgi:endonuclease/exonuclease/phosphatase family metal-dependent hydrolase